MNEQGINAPGIVIQKMLYDHPLYEALTPGKTQLNVLVLGSGTYGQQFIDHCLQAGQMKGYSLCVTAVSHAPEEDRQNYLAPRPALERFVNVNGSLDGDPRAYARLRFISLNEACQLENTPTLHFETADTDAARQANRSLLSDIVTVSVDQEDTFDYIFIALGNNRLNQSLAEICEAETGYWGKCVKCPVCYIRDDDGTGSRMRTESMLYPVYINEPITPQTIDPQLEQMAFNTDISWNSSLNIDVSAAFREFRQTEYNYSASLAYALSIPHKLFSIGILLQNRFHPYPVGRFPGMITAETTLEAAKIFSREILEKRKTDPDARKKFDTLVYLEHRRWVLNLVCAGWDAPRNKKGRLNLQHCVDCGTVRNKADKTHPCLVFSTEATPLSSPAYTADGHKKWNSAFIDPALDELDRMSIELHQRFYAQANRFRAGNPLQSSHILQIETLIAGSGETVIRAFRQFLFCLKNILNGSEGYTRQFGYYRSCFEETLAGLSPERRNQISAGLNQIKADFFPVIESNLYRNYKETDETLIEKIPFILTYHFQDSLAMAFEDGKYQNGRNEAVFANVASATVLCPEKIYYLYHFTRDSRQEALINKITAVLNYLGKRRVHSAITFVAAFPAGQGKKRKHLQQALEGLKSGGSSENAVFEDYAIIEYTDTEEIMDRFGQFLSDRHVSLFDGSTALFASAFDNMHWLSRIEKGNIPYFEFNWKDKTFPKHIGCDHLQYIQDNSCIRIQDMFSLMNAEDTRFNLPDFSEDYETLWDIYTGSNASGKKTEESIGNWNRLCNILGEYADRQTPLATFPLRRSFSLAKKAMTFPLPAGSGKLAGKLLNQLIEFGIIDPTSCVSEDSGTGCSVQLLAEEGLETTLGRLFGGSKTFSSAFGTYALRRLDAGSDCVQIWLHDMDVSRVSLSTGGWNSHESLYGVLKKLAAKNFIHNLEQDPEHPHLVSFRYASPRIRKLLTSAGEILEIYTYYQVLSTGYFDDVACGYEFRWQDGDVKNELDIVATKGFRSIIVECKAVQKLELDYYHKLHSIAGHFGIGTVKVLVGNTYRRNDHTLDPVNRMQRTRGDQLNIITISEANKILNIGQALVDEIRK